MTVRDDPEELPVRLGMVSTYSPRRCAVAAFATDLGRALSPEFDLVVCALDRYGLSYPPEVAAVIREDERDDYRRAARVLAEHEVDAALIQYDDSSFGGPHVLDLAHELRRLELPYVVVLHTETGVDHDQDMTTAALTAGAQRVLVFTERARRRLPSSLGLDPAVVERVPVGVPAVPALSGPPADAATGPVLTWIGPLTPERGFDTALSALTAIREVHPGARLVAAGRPVTDAYRGRVGVELVEARLTPADQAALLARTDVVLAPMPAAGRSWSAILTAAVAAGCPVVAPRYPYAEELLGQSAGTVVEPGDAEATAVAALNLLAANRVCAQSLSWPAVVDQYARVLRAAAQPTARAGGSAAPLRLDRVRPPAGRDPQSWARLAVVLADPGMSTRDSRALSWLDRSVTALAAAAAAADDANATGWALWGLSAVTHGAGVPPALARRARQLRAMVAALAAAPTARPTLTADAYAVLGLTRDSAVDGCTATVLHAAADRLSQAGRANGRGLSWPWFSDRLDVAPGARLPQAMIAAGRWLGDPAMLHCGLTSLDWYARRAGLGAAAAQLRLPTPLAESAADAGAVVEALVEAHLVSGATRPARLALTAFGWFHGGNRYGTAVYDPDLGVAAPVLAAGDGGPMTAVGPDGTLAYLGALLRLASAGLLELPSLDTGRRDLAVA